MRESSSNKIDWRAWLVLGCALAAGCRSVHPPATTLPVATAAEAAEGDRHRSPRVGGSGSRWGVESRDAEPAVEHRSAAKSPTTQPAAKSTGVSSVGKTVRPSAAAVATAGSTISTLPKPALDSPTTKPLADRTKPDSVHVDAPRYTSNARSARSGSIGIPALTLSDPTLEQKRASILSLPAIVGMSSKPTAPTSLTVTSDPGSPTTGDAKQGSVVHLWDHLDGTSKASNGSSVTSHAAAPVISGPASDTSRPAGALLVPDALWEQASRSLGLAFSCASGLVLGGMPQFVGDAGAWQRQQAERRAVEVNADRIARENLNHAVLRALLGSNPSP